MINGIYLATSGMNVEKKRMDVLSNNLANINSTGFKKREINFEAVGIELSGDSWSSNVKEILDSYQKLGDIDIDIAAGPLKQTENPFDFSINNNNFFIVETENGEVLTKNGSFSLDSENFLVNQDGYYVIGKNGHINIDSSQIMSIDSSGNILNGEQFIDSLKIVSVESGMDLITGNDCYFKLKEGIIGGEGDDLIIRQGFLEMSNVNGIDEMVEIIAIMRAYETNQKVINMQDQSLAKTVSTVGRVN